MAYMNPNEALFWKLNPKWKICFKKKFGIIMFFTMSTGSHILSTDSFLCFLELAREPDLPVVIFPLLVVIFYLLPLDGRIPIVLVSLPVMIFVFCHWKVRYQ